MSAMNPLLAISPLDGRYADRVQPLSDITSEYGLIKRRVLVELAWFKTLGSGLLPGVTPMDGPTQAQLEHIGEAFTLGDAEAIKTIEHRTNHDVKAVELWLQEQLSGHPVFKDRIGLVHFGITSEDVNNLAYALQLRDVRETIIWSAWQAIVAELTAKADEYASLAMLARTHGQPATPTTLGKEINVFAERLRAALRRFEAVTITAKFNGATGNYNALYVAYPEVDWQTVSAQFISSFGFASTAVTTQIEPHDSLAVFCNEIALGNTILTDLARDLWSYISLGYFKQSLKAHEVGSSTMPHKVNPIDFENAEANLAVANATFGLLAAKLPISRWQRDLSDSSALRSLSEAFGHSLVAYQALKQGLTKLQANSEKIAADLETEWSVLAEAVQTIMRRYGVPDAYEKIKAVSRGKAWSHEDYVQLVDSLDLPPDAKKLLRELRPETYVGQAATLARLHSDQ